MSLMVVTVGDSTTLEVDVEEIQDFIDYIHHLQDFLADPALFKMHDWFEELQKAIRHEAIEGARTCH